ncbi:hypothetical protein N9W41_00780 [bacterium]|nr:hypothetical protein [bacterium]
MTKFFKSVIILFVIFSVGYASAKSKKSKNTVLNFEDELIEGNARKPELFYLLERKQVNFKKLIQLRDDFLPEMRRTTEQLDRVGGGN